MASFVPTLLLPLLLGLVFLPMARRQIVLLSPIAWVPDVDYIIPSEHRALTHTVLIPMAVAGALLVLWRKTDATSRLLEFATRPGHPGNLLLAVYYLVSHLILDLFLGGVVLFWPVWDRNFFLFFQILLDTKNNQFVPDGTAGTEVGAPALAPLYEWVSPLDTALVVMVGMALLIRFFVLRRNPRPVRVVRVVQGPGPKSP